MNILVWNLSMLESSGVNTGDKAIVASITSSLKRTNPEAKVTVVSGDPQYARKLYDVDGVNLKQVLSAIRKTDLFVVAGGEIVRDSSCLLYTPSVLSGPLLAKALGKRIACHSVEIADIAEVSIFGRLLTRLLLNRADLVTVRNNESQTALRNMHVTNQAIHVTADPVFTLTPTSPHRAREILAMEGIEKKSGPLIGIMPRRVFPQNFNILPVNIRLKLKLLSLDTCNRIQKAVAQSADYMVEKLGASIVFFPMYVGTKFGYGDDQFSNEIISLMCHKESAKTVTGDYSAQDVLGVFGQMDLAVGTPLHSVILAATAGVPIVNISYSLKTERIVKLLGQQDLTIRAENVNGETLKAKIATAWNDRQNLRLKILKEAVLQREKALTNVDLTRRLIDNLT